MYSLDYAIKVNNQAHSFNQNPHNSEIVHARLAIIYASRLIVAGIAWNRQAIEDYLAYAGSLTRRDGEAKVSEALTYLEYLHPFASKAQRQRMRACMRELVLTLVAIRQ